jgi:hypothetical protein
VAPPAPIVPDASVAPTPLDAGPLAIPAPGFDRADFAVLEQRAVVFYAIGDSIDEVGRVPLDPVDLDQLGRARRIGWGDRENLYVLTAPFAVLRVTVDGAVWLPVPPLDEYRRDRPEGDVVPLDSDRFAIDGGAAWYGVCPWGTPENGISPRECLQWVYIELAPDPGVRELLGGAESKGMPSFPWPDAAPDDVTIVPGKSALGEPTMRCRGPGRKKADFDMALGFHWLSIDPPAVLVENGIYGPPGAGIVRWGWEVREGCAKKARMSGSAHPIAGPGGLWMSSTGKTDELGLYRAGTFLGTLSDALEGAFRPAP